MATKQKESLEEREARKGGENELAGYDSAQRAKRQMEKMDRQQRQPKRKPAR